MDNVAFVFARGGSKGVVGKNLAQIGETTLLGHTLQFAIESRIFSEIYLSTDSAKIAEESKKFRNVNLIERPSYLATDNSPELLSWKHAVEFVSKTREDEYKFVSLSCTAPLRSLESVRLGIDSLSLDWDLIISMTPSNRSPWFNMVKKTDNGIETVLKADTSVFRRQDAPISYDLTTAFYVSWPTYIRKSDNLWSGRVNGVEIPVEESIDIDSKYDLEVANLLLRGKLAK